MGTGLQYSAYLAYNRLIGLRVYRVGIFLFRYEVQHRQDSLCLPLSALYVWKRKDCLPEGIRRDRTWQHMPFSISIFHVNVNVNVT